jgi:hypothetical protein
MQDDLRSEVGVTPHNPSPFLLRTGRNNLAFSNLYVFRVTTPIKVINRLCSNNYSLKYPVSWNLRKSARAKKLDVRSTSEHRKSWELAYWTSPRLGKSAAIYPQKVLRLEK